MIPMGPFLIGIFCYSVINNSPELGFCFDKKLCNENIQLIWSISTVYSNRTFFLIFSFYLHSQLYYCYEPELPQPLIWTLFDFWTENVLDGITSHSKLSKDRQRSSTVQGCPHLHVRESDRNYCDLTHLAVLHLKSSMCTRPDTKVIQKQTLFCVTCIFWKGKQLFSHCLRIATFSLYMGLQ